MSLTLMLLLLLLLAMAFFLTILRPNPWTLLRRILPVSSRRRL
jgi:hypothetical protein